MTHFAEAGFVRVNDDLQPGDVILMQVRSPHDANHSAVYLGDGFMLHHLYGRLSSRDVFGGYWRECARGYVRYAI
ncbi:NlpC/P60 family protein [Silvimonas sp.]|uniref:NlpC/P60 family protein n=1 Tax=Silvimonas sp. TaxID=2650811 RepID=UPI00386720E5